VPVTDSDLFIATRDGDLDIIKYLLEQGLDIHAEHDAALFVASKYGHLPVVEYLIRRGANVTADNDKALVAAIYGNHLDVVKYLLAHGANEVVSINGREIDAKEYILEAHGSDLQD
jgi:ankyrin repeat protein